MSPQRPVYLDYAATTPVDPRVAKAMLPWIAERFGNAASSGHAWGWEAEEAIEAARAQVASLVGAEPRELVWTSGATESNNLALKGVAESYQDQGKHLITVKTEHKAVLDSMRELERRGFDITILDVASNGLLDPDALKAALRADTVLVSVMAVNNEIGVTQDLQAIGALCRAHGVLFHVDAAQATGKLALDMQSLPVDLMSLTAHKTYGPKGIGALYVRRKPRVRLHAQLHGGGHERGMRSGTLPTHQIVGMGEAYRLAQQEFAQDRAHVVRLQKQLLDGLAQLDHTTLNGDLQQRVPHSLNISFAGMDGEALVTGLTDIAVSSSSACSSASLEPSHVLRALGRSDALAHASLRLSYGRFTTPADIDCALAAITHNVQRLRALNPDWSSHGGDVAPQPDAVFH